MIDEKIGEMLQVLDEKGYLDNAVVVFTSDHGDTLGDHGHSQKWTMYEEIVHVPAVVWAPGRFDGGRTVDSLCQIMDLGPTILELAGVEPPESFEAKSLVPALEGDDWEGRDYVFSEHARDPILTGTEFMSMVRDRQWKLVHFLDDPAGQLFNLVDDPDEVHNLWDNPDFDDVKRELLDVVREWHIRSQSRTAAWSQDWR